MKKYEPTQRGAKSYAVDLMESIGIEEYRLEYKSGKKLNIVTDLGLYVISYDGSVRLVLTPFK